MANSRSVASTADAQYKALLNKIETLVKRVKTLAEEEELLVKRVPRTTKAVLSITKAYQQSKTSKNAKVANAVTLDEVKASARLLEQMKTKLEELKIEKDETYKLLAQLSDKVDEIPTELARELDKLAAASKSSSARSSGGASRPKESSSPIGAMM